MKSFLSRAVTAAGLGISLWVGTIAGFGAPQQPQNQSQPTTQATQEQKSTDAQSTDQAGTQQTSNRKALPTGDDPTQIGKRNINKGIWAHGPFGAKGLETEVKIGRQVAAEVDKEAKFVDDPIITEY